MDKLSAELRTLLMKDTPTEQERRRINQISSSLLPKARRAVQRVRDGS